MQLNLHDLIPDEISDEAAYHLVNFLMALATELDSYYFDKMQRYTNDLMPSEAPLLDLIDDEEKYF